jgi:hypothetical protein
MNVDLDTIARAESSIADELKIQGVHVTPALLTAARRRLEAKVEARISTLSASHSKPGQ